MTELLLKTLESGFKLWTHSQKSAMYKKFLKLKKGIRDERNKPTLERDMVKYGYLVLSGCLTRASIPNKS